MNKPMTLLAVTLLTLPMYAKAFANGSCDAHGSGIEGSTISGTIDCDAAEEVSHLHLAAGKSTVDPAAANIQLLGNACGSEFIEAQKDLVELRSAIDAGIKDLFKLKPDLIISVSPPYVSFPLITQCIDSGSEEGGDCLNENVQKFIQAMPKGMSQLNKNVKTAVCQKEVAHAKKSVEDRKTELKEILAAIARLVRKDEKSVRLLAQLCGPKLDHLRQTVDFLEANVSLQRQLIDQKWNILNKPGNEAKLQAAMKLPIISSRDEFTKLTLLGQYKKEPSEDQVSRAERFLFDSIESDSKGEFSVKINEVKLKAAGIDRLNMLNEVCEHERSNSLEIRNELGIEGSALQARNKELTEILKKFFH